MGWLARLGGAQAMAPPRVEYCRVLHAGPGSAMLRDLRALRDAAACFDGSAPDTDDAEPWGVQFAAYADHAADPATGHAAGHPAQLLAGVRLVHPPAGHPFPFQQHCQSDGGAALPVSGAAAEAAGLVLHPAWRAHPALLLGLYREMLRYSRAAGIDHWYAAMEAPLAASLIALGLPFVRIGPDLYVLALEALLPHLRAHAPLLAAWFGEAPVTWWMQRRLRAHGVHLRR